MDLELDETQGMLRDSLRRLLAGRYDGTQRLRMQATLRGWDTALWSDYAAMGLLGLGVAPIYGGLGPACVETMVAMEELGRVAALEPVLAVVVLAAGAIQALGSETQRAHWLPRIVEGHACVAFAHAEAMSRYDLDRVDTIALRTEAGWTVNGSKCNVTDGAHADAWIVSARIASSTGALALFLIEPDTPGLTCTPRTTHDGRREADMVLDQVQLPAHALLGDPAQHPDLDAASVIRRLHEQAMLGACAQAVGSMSALLELTTAYLRVREQFGVKLATFQALQHRLVDMAVALEEARSMVLLGTMVLDDLDTDLRSAALAATKVQVSLSCQLVGEQAVQLHGGMGLTMECPVAPLFLRTMLLESQYGDAEHHLDALMAAGGLYGTRQGPGQPVGLPC